MGVCETFEKTGVETLPWETLALEVTFRFVLLKEDVIGGVCGGDAVGDRAVGKTMLVLIASAHNAEASNAFMNLEVRIVVDDDGGGGGDDDDDDSGTHTNDDNEEVSIATHVMTSAGTRTTAANDDGAVAVDTIVGGGVVTKMTSSSWHNCGSVTYGRSVIYGGSVIYGSENAFDGDNDGQ